MRRLAASLLLLPILLAALPFGRPASGAMTCLFERPASLEAHVVEMTQAASAVIVATVSSVDRSLLVLTPEAYLKGAAKRQVRIDHNPNYANSCMYEFRVGQRVLVFLQGSPLGPSWPYSNAVLTLQDGLVSYAGLDAPEDEIVARIRGITGQYAVPAASNDEGASIDWRTTVLPVTAALLLIFGIGLLLMRTWHRIDPS